MYFRQFVILQLLFVSVVTSGCQLMNSFEWYDESMPLTEREEQILDALRVHLAKDSWQKNRQWNLSEEETLEVLQRDLEEEFLERDHEGLYPPPITARDSILNGKSRWKYGDVVIEGLLKKLDQKTKKNWSANSVKQASYYDKSEPIGISPNISGTSWYLREASREENFTGWNATILHTQRDVYFIVRSQELATRYRKTLERLVTKKLYYDALTGNPVSREKQVKSSDKNKSNSKNEKQQIPNEKIKLTDASSLDEYIQHAKLIEKQPELSETEPANSNRLFSFFQKEKDSPPKQNIQPVSQSMRLAAAEAWCRLLAATLDQADKTKALAPVGKVLKNSLLPDSIRAELFLGLAPWIPPNRIPRLSLSFSDATDRNKPKTSPILRLAAIEACVLHALTKQKELREDEPQSDEMKKLTYDPSVWPKRIMNAQFDTDPRIRRLFGLWLVLSQHPQAFEISKSQLADVDSHVHLAAHEHLGILHTPEAFKLLNSRSHRKEMPIRKYAMKGLAYWGPENLGRFSDDEFAEVREALAVSLKIYRTVSSAIILQKLLSDRSPNVQLAVLESVEGWHEALAVPLLLHGMAEGTPLTSQRALALLQKKTKLTLSFPISSHVSVRRTAVAKLAEKKYLPLVFPHDSTKPSLVNKFLHSTEEKELLKEYVSQILNNPPESEEYYAASEKLHALDSSSIPVLETVLQETNAENEKFFTQDLLPELSELYRAVIDLESNEPSDKLRGIRVLEKHGMTASLSPIIVRRVLNVLKNGSDRAIWRSAMNAVMGDSSPLHAEVAKYAVHHFAPEIRILACRYFQRHRQADYASHLLELLEDHDYNVKMAAIEAAGYCPNPIIINGTPGRTKLTDEKTRGLTKILLEPDRELQTSAALSLARLGNEIGFQELIRASFHRDRKFVEDAFRKMGQSGRRRFVEHLVQRCWIEKHPATRIVILQSLDSLVPEDERPSGLSDAKMYEEKAKVWSNWLENQQGKRHIRATNQR